MAQNDGDFLTVALPTTSVLSASPRCSSRCVRSVTSSLLNKSPSHGPQNYGRLLRIHRMRDVEESLKGYGTTDTRWRRVPDYLLIYLSIIKIRVSISLSHMYGSYFCVRI